MIFQNECVGRKKSEVEQFEKNAKRARTDLELLDVAFDRLQNLSVRLQELAVESANGIMSAKEREIYCRSRDDQR